MRFLNDFRLFSLSLSEVQEPGGNQLSRTRGHGSVVTTQRHLLGALSSWGERPLEWMVIRAEWRYGYTILTLVAIMVIFHDFTFWWTCRRAFIRSTSTSGNVISTRWRYKVSRYIWFHHTVWPWRGVKDCLHAIKTRGVHIYINSRLPFEKIMFF